MKNCEPDKDERPVMIITGIIALYTLLILFTDYLFCLHRINFIAACVIFLIITISHIERFLIIKKLLQIDYIKINQDELEINKKHIELEDIEQFSIIEYKPNIIFFLNNRMIIFKYAQFIIKTKTNEIRFCIQGSKKIALLKEFLTVLTNRNK